MNIPNTDLQPGATFQIELKELPEAFLEDARREIALFAVGLTLDGQFAGSGTLIQWEDNFGVLTAEHVVNNPEDVSRRMDFSIGSKQRLGFLFTEFPQGMEIEVRYLSCTTLGPRLTDQKGPDLAVIKIPTCTQLSNLKARKSFWNLSVNTQEKYSAAGRDDGCAMIAGHPGEQEQAQPGCMGFHEVRFLPGLVGTTGVSRRFSEGEFDYVEVGSDSGPESAAPRSYRGVSGGGLWQVPICLDSKNPEKGIHYRHCFLMGVAYLQTDEVDGKRTIRGHGPQTIYLSLLTKLRQADAFLD